MLSSHPPCPKFDTTKSKGKEIGLIIYTSSKDWAVKYNPLVGVFRASDFDVDLLYLHKETGADPDSGVWILLPDLTVVFYCNFWQSAGFGSHVINKRTLSIHNRIEGNYYLRYPDLNDIECYVTILDSEII